MGVSKYLWKETQVTAVATGEGTKDPVVDRAAISHFSVYPWAVCSLEIPEACAGRVAGALGTLTTPLSQSCSLLIIPLSPPPPLPPPPRPPSSPPPPLICGLEVRNQGPTGGGSGNHHTGRRKWRWSERSSCCVPSPSTRGRCGPAASTELQAGDLPLLGWRPRDIRPPQLVAVGSKG